MRLTNNELQDLKLEAEHSVTYEDGWVKIQAAQLLRLVEFMLYDIGKSEDYQEAMDEVSALRQEVAELEKELAAQEEYASKLEVEIDALDDGGKTAN